MSHTESFAAPCTSQIDERKCFDAIDVRKDVDGVTCLGFGNMAMGIDALWLMYACWNYKIN